MNTQINLSPTHFGHAPAIVRSQQERFSDQADLAAKLIKAALVAAFAKTKVKVNGECDVEEINELGQVTFSLPSLSIVTDLSRAQLMAEWALQDFEVETTGVYQHVESALRVMKS